MEGINFLLNPNLAIAVTPTQKEHFLTIKKGTVITSLSLQEWADFYRNHETINVAVHNAWHQQPDEGTDTSVWKGLPTKSIEKNSNMVADLIGADPLIIMLAQRHFHYMLQKLLDAKMNAITIGDEKRIRVRFSGKDVQIHLFTYDPTTLAVVTVLQLSFHEYIELYKIVTQINQLVPAITDHVQKPSFPHHILP